MKSLNWLLDDILLEILLMKKKNTLHRLAAHHPYLERSGEGIRWYLKLKLLCFTEAMKGVTAGP